MIKLAIGLPAYTLSLDIGHAAMWFGLGAAMAAAPDKFTISSFASYAINGIDLARNTIVYDALQAGADWCLMVDADTYHATAGGSVGLASNADAVGDAGADLLQMIRDADRGKYVDHSGVLVDIPGLAHSNGVGLVGAPVRGRGIGDNGVCVKTFVAGVLQPTTLTDLVGKVRPVDRIGGAVSAINLNWLRTHWPTGPWFEMEHDYTGRPKNARGEDYSCCAGIYALGGTVLCDGRFVPEHVDRRRLVGELPPENLVAT